MVMNRVARSSYSIFICFSYSSSFSFFAPQLKFRQLEHLYLVTFSFIKQKSL